MTKYNGWTNHSTWMVNLWFDNFNFTDDLQKFEDCTTSDEVLDNITYEIQLTVEEYVELYNREGFILDVIQSTLNEVNYQEIAEHYLQDVIDELELRQSDFSERFCVA